ncbi:LINE-1 reverse transcriptase-like protein, partial [Bienertia sinuspersici]
IYGFNESCERARLWEGLKEFYSKVDGAWVVLGDFNAPLNFDDRIGRPVTLSKVWQFKDMVNYYQLHDLCSIGAKYTWTNKQFGEARVCSKIDRVLVNEEWVLSINNSVVHFIPKIWFDHCPAIIYFEEKQVVKDRTFKFFDIWCSHAFYKDIVEKGWKLEVRGYKMFQTIQNVKEIKKDLKKLNGEA